MLQGNITNVLKLYEYPQIDLDKDLANGQLSEEKIIDIIEGHYDFVNKYNDNKNFFIGRNKPVRYNLDEHAPDNEINIPFARTLTRTVKGYMFKPGNITYELTEGTDKATQEYFENFKYIYQLNKEELKNAENGENQSKYGIGFEILFSKLIDGVSYPYFCSIDPTTIIPVFDFTVEKNLVCAIRYFKLLDQKSDDGVDEEVKQVEVYYANKISTYTLTSTSKTKKLVLVKESENFYNDVPIVMYKNNDEYLADYEPVQCMLQLLDKLMSDSANELDRFASAYLIMINYVLAGNKEEAREKLDKIKQLRVFQIDKDGDVRFLTKDIPIAFFQEIKNTIRQDIVYHTGIPDFNDQSFGTASGIAIKYKLIGLENLCGDKEAYFKAGLERRINLINNFLKIQNDTLEIKNIEIKFKRNLPENLVEAIDSFNKIFGKVSDITALNLLPFIKDVQAELDRIKKQQEENMPESFNIDEDEQKTDELKDKEIEENTKDEQKDSA